MTKRHTLLWSDLDVYVYTLFLLFKLGLHLKCIQLQKWDSTFGFNFNNYIKL